MEQTYVIEGRPITSTNSHMIVENKQRGGYMIIKSALARKYQGDATLQLRGQKNKKGYHCVTTECTVELMVYRERNSGDVDNYSKAVFDALQNANCIINDKLIQRMVVEKHKDKENPRVEITIRVRRPSTVAISKPNQ